MNRTWHWLDDMCIKKKEYCVFVSRLKVECTDPMQDTRSYRWENDGELVIAPFVKNYRNQMVAHPDNKGSIHLRSTDMELLNRIWYNIKHQDFTFAQLKNILGEDVQ